MLGGLTLATFGPLLPSILKPTSPHLDVVAPLLPPLLSPPPSPAP